MRRGVLAVCGAAALAVLLVGPALAHPLGNFTINRYSRVEIIGAEIRVLYVLDFAEIAAFQEKQRLGADPAYLEHQVARLTAGLTLLVDEQPVPLRVADRSLQFLPGQGGLDTLRLEILYTAPTPSSSARSQAASYRDDNYVGRLGWQEIVVQAGQGGQLLESSAPATSVSDELRTYPEELLSSPSTVTEARFTFVPGATAADRPPTLGAGGETRPLEDRFAALIAGDNLSLPLLAFALLTAVVLGALHALEPGHGKAMMAGYLVGTRGTWRQAVILGLTITVSHTAGVFALGLVTLYAADIVTPERLYPWLTLVSGLLVLGFGAGLVVSRARLALRGHDHDHPHSHGHGHHHHDHHDHRHHHHHGHSHGHDHGQARSLLGRGGLVALGISGGLIPCPSALVVLLSAVALHRVLFGLLLIVAFSIGLALVLTGIGVALASGAPLLRRLPPSGVVASVGRAGRFLPIASALVVTVVGLGLTLQALPGVLR